MKQLVIVELEDGFLAIPSEVESIPTARRTARAFSQLDGYSVALCLKDYVLDYFKKPIVEEAPK